MRSAHLLLQAGHRSVGVLQLAVQAFPQRCALRQLPMGHTQLLPDTKRGVIQIFLFIYLVIKIFIYTYSVIQIFIDLVIQIFIRIAKLAIYYINNETLK